MLSLRWLGRVRPIGGMARAAAGRRAGRVRPHPGGRFSGGRAWSTSSWWNLSAMSHPLGPCPGRPPRGFAYAAHSSDLSARQHHPLLPSGPNQKQGSTPRLPVA